MILCPLSVMAGTFASCPGFNSERSGNPDNAGGKKLKVPMAAADLINFLLEELGFFFIINDLVSVQAIFQSITQHYIIEVQLDIQNIPVADHGFRIVTHKGAMTAFKGKGHGT